MCGSEWLCGFSDEQRLTDSARKGDYALMSYRILCFKTQLYVHLGTQTVISSIWIQVICSVWRGILHKYVYCVTVEWALFLIVNVEYISYPFPMLRPVFFTKQAAGVKQMFCFGASSINHQIARQVMSLWYDFPSQCLLLFLRHYIS